MNTSVKRLPIYALLLVLGVLGALIVVLAATPGQQAQAANNTPIFRLPFPKDETWKSHTWKFSSSGKKHNPVQASDLNNYSHGGGDSDFGELVVASAAGKVTTSTYTGPTSYGKYIVINHRGPWQTLYAHLSERCVSDGQKVEMGDKIGLVGESGGPISPHLHYEQHQYGDPVRIQLGSDRQQIYYYGYRNITSHNPGEDSDSC